MSPSDITFTLLGGILCALNAADVLTTHLIFKKAQTARERNPLLARFVKTGAPFTWTLTGIKVLAIGFLLGASWIGLQTLPWGDYIVLPGLAFVNGWYTAIVASNTEEYLKL